MQNVETERVNLDTANSQLYVQLQELIIEHILLKQQIRDWIAARLSESAHSEESPQHQAQRSHDHSAGSGGHTCGSQEESCDTRADSQDPVSSDQEMLEEVSPHVADSQTGLMSTTSDVTLPTTAADVDLPQTSSQLYQLDSIPAREHPPPVQEHLPPAREHPPPTSHQSWSISSLLSGIETLDGMTEPITTTPITSSYTAQPTAWVQKVRKPQSGLQREHNHTSSHSHTRSSDGAPRPPISTATETRPSDLMSTETSIPRSAVHLTNSAQACPERELPSPHPIVQPWVGRACQHHHAHNHAHNQYGMRQPGGGVAQPGGGVVRPVRGVAQPVARPVRGAAQPGGGVAHPMGGSEPGGMGQRDRHWTPTTSHQHTPYARIHPPVQPHPSTLFQQSHFTPHPFHNSESFWPYQVPSSDSHHATYHSTLSRSYHHSAPQSTSHPHSMAPQVRSYHHSAAPQGRSYQAFGNHQQPLPYIQDDHVMSCDSMATPPYPMLPHPSHSNTVWRPYSESNRSTGFYLSDILGPSEHPALQLEPTPPATTRMASFFVDRLLDDMG